MPEVLEQYHNPKSGYRWRNIETYVPGELGVNKLRLIYHPGVYLVGYTVMCGTVVDEFLSDHGIDTFKPGVGTGRGTDGELMVELGGRLCYMSYEKPRPGGLDSFISNIRAEGHGSVFEHPHYNFILTGVSRNLTLELNRCRMLSISQLSGRYVDSSTVGMVVDPDLDGEQTERWAQVALHAMREYQRRFDENYTRFDEAYRKAHSELGELDRKVQRRLIKQARERARDVLPGALETRVLYTINARAARFLLEQRCSPDAAWEIRRAMNGVYKLLKAHDPRLFSDYTETPLDDGTFAISSPHKKV